MPANSLSFHLVDAPKYIVKRNIASALETTESALRNAFASDVRMNKQPNGLR